MAARKNAAVALVLLASAMACGDVDGEDGRADADRSAAPAPAATSSSSATHEPGSTTKEPASKSRTAGSSTSSSVPARGGGEATVSVDRLPVAGEYRFTRERSSTLTVAGMDGPHSNTDTLSYVTTVKASSGGPPRRELRWAVFGFDDSGEGGDPQAQTHELWLAEGDVLGGMLDTRVGGSVPPATWDGRPPVSTGRLANGSSWEVSGSGFTNMYRGRQRAELSGRANVMGKEQARAAGRTFDAWRINRTWHLVLRDPEDGIVTLDVRGTSEELYVPTLGLPVRLDAEVDVDEPGRATAHDVYKTTLDRLPSS